MVMSKKIYSDNKKNNHISEYIESSLAKYGALKYGYFIIDKRDTANTVIISNIPEYFSDVYLANQHQDIDPIIIKALNFVSPFAWDESLMINSRWKLSAIFDAARPHHDIVSGYTFVLHAPGEKMALLSLYVNKFLMPDQFENIAKHKDEIQGVLIRAYEMLTHLYIEEQKNNRNTSDLTEREMEILHWSSKGKTYPEIALMLNITVSTVKFHMAKVIKKLGVKNAKHAIRLGAEMNITLHSSGE
jgi:LuxR family quorum-sensing system transcriptional regulator ExpR